MDTRAILSLDALRPWLEENRFHARDWGLLATALDRPWTTFGGNDLYPDVWHKTGALIDSLEQSHPLLGGNKRLRVLLGLLMLRSHGIDDNEITDDQWFGLITDIATHPPPVDDIADHLRSFYS
ncbi:Fic family protein [Corynebacterium sp. A21]|uniref:Fic family protein n=1 Tax=Corynebacterium sp. A21 TaxID=3457318 RepID=UPI003FD431BE